MNLMIFPINIHIKMENKMKKYINHSAILMCIIIILACEQNDSEWNIISYGKATNYWECESLKNYFRKDKLSAGYVRVFIHNLRNYGYEDIQADQFVKRIDPTSNLSFRQIFNTLKDNWWNYETDYIEYYIFGLVYKENNHYTMIIFFDPNYVPDKYRRGNIPSEYEFLEKIASYLYSDEFRANRIPLPNS